MGKSQEFKFQSDTTGGISLVFKEDKYSTESFIIDSNIVYGFDIYKDKETVEILFSFDGKTTIVNFYFDYKEDTLTNVEVESVQLVNGYKSGPNRHYWTYKSDSIIRQVTNYENDSKYGKTVELYKDGKMFAKGAYNGVFLSQRHDLEKLDLTYYVTNTNDTLFVDSCQYDGYPTEFFIQYGIPVYYHTSPFYLKKGEWVYYNKEGDIIRREYYNEDGIRQSVEIIKEITWTEEDDKKISPTLKEYRKYIKPHIKERKGIKTNCEDDE